MLHGEKAIRGQARVAGSVVATSGRPTAVSQRAYGRAVTTPGLEDRNVLDRRPRTRDIPTMSRPVTNVDEELAALVAAIERSEAYRRYSGAPRDDITAEEAEAELEDLLAATNDIVSDRIDEEFLSGVARGSPPATEDEVVAAAQEFAAAVHQVQTEVSRAEFFGVLSRCRHVLEEELDVDLDGLA